MLYNFHDYVLLRSLNETYPGILEFHGGQVIFNEFLGFGSKKPKFNPETHQAYKQWAQQMADSGQGTQFQQEPHGNQVAKWGQDMTAAGYQGINPDQQVQPAQAQKAMPVPNQQAQPAQASKALPVPNQQAQPQQPGQPAQSQPQQPGNPVRVDYNLLKGVLDKIQTPKLKQIMQQWMSTTFKNAG